MVIDPRIPKEWKQYSVKRLFRGSVYIINVYNENHVSSGIKRIEVDGVTIKGNLIKPSSGKGIFNVNVYMGQIDEKNIDSYSSTNTLRLSPNEK